MRLGVGKRATLPTVPMIFAAKYGTHAEDLGEGGARGFYLGFDAPV